MKISNSKKELARIISENGGWRDGAEWAAQDACGTLNSYQRKPVYSSGCAGFGHGGGYFHKICAAAKIKNWHQTILSRAEYFHLYPAPDADGWIEWRGGECPVDEGDRIDVKLSDGDEFFDVDSDLDWDVDAGGCNIIAYRLHKPNAVKPTDFGAIGDDETSLAVKDGLESMEYRPTIEQLAADYRNAKDYADRKQQEADAAKADADAKLKALELAGAALWLSVSPITKKQEPELVITDWRDLQAGDVISVSGEWWEPDSEYTVDVNDGSRDAPIRVGGYWARIGECSFKFIRRP